MKTSWNNEPMSAITHGVGACCAIAGLIALVIGGAGTGSALAVTTLTIFGLVLFLAYLMSTLYHALCRDRTPRAKRVLQILDHSAIYLLIAGTYTPVVLLSLPPSWGWALFGTIWGLALFGIIMKAANIALGPVLSVIYYLAMGWLVVIAFVPLSQSLSHTSLTLLVLGGLLYSIGAIFFGLDHVVRRTRWWGMHEVFHLFVMGGSTAHVFMLFSLLS